MPGSHRRREYDTAGATTLHPPKGSVVLMEQRATHRGRGILSGLLRPWLAARQDRILISIGYGADNVYTDEFERGTRKRQRAQCGAACVRGGGK